MKDLTIGNALFYNKQIEGKGEQNIKIQDLTPFAFIKLDFNTQNQLLRNFYKTQGMNMPTMTGRGIVQ